jgi:CRP-like cAMP-binding protein
MYARYSMDRSLRLIGGIILVSLPMVAGEVGTTAKIVAIIVGLYGIITGMINFCPIGYFILKEMSGKRKKMSAENSLRASDVKELNFFKGMTEEEMGQVLSYALLKEYPRDTSVIVEGEATKKLCIIFSGLFKIVKSIAADNHKIIATIADGETYGEMSFFDDMPPCVSVMSIESSKVLEIDEMGFNELIQKNPYLGIKLLVQLMQISNTRIRALNEQIASMGNWVLKSRQQLRMNAA